MPENILPQGISEEQFVILSQEIRAAATKLGDDIRVHGSRAKGTAREDSDIDIAIRVSAEKFNELIVQSFGVPNSGSAKEKTLQHAVETGKIQAGEAGLKLLRRNLVKLLGIKVDISIICVDGKFDLGPWIELRKQENPNDTNN